MTAAPGAAGRRGARGAPGARGATRAPAGRRRRTARRARAARPRRRRPRRAARARSSAASSAARAARRVVELRERAAAEPFEQRLEPRVEQPRARAPRDPAARARRARRTRAPRRAAPRPSAPPARGRAGGTWPAPAARSPRPSSLRPWCTAARPSSAVAYATPGVVARAAPHLQRAAQRLVGRRQPALVDEHLADVAVAERGVDDVARPRARVAGAAVEHDRLVPVAGVEGERAEVVEHGRLRGRGRRAARRSRARGAECDASAPRPGVVQRPVEQVAGVGDGALLAGRLALGDRLGAEPDRVVAAALALARDRERGEHARRGSAPPRGPSTPVERAQRPQAAAHRLRRVARAVGELGLAAAAPRPRATGSPAHEPPRAPERGLRVLGLAACARAPRRAPIHAVRELVRGHVRGPRAASSARR